MLARRTLCLLLLSSSLYAQAPAGGDKGVWQRYLNVLKAKLTLEPNDPNMHYMIAQVYGRLGDRANVLKFAQNARSLGAHGARVDILLADFLAGEGDLDGAIKKYYRLLEHTKDNAYSLVQVWKLIRRIEDENATVGVDMGAIRSVLNSRGFYVPRKMARDRNSANKAQSLTRQAESLLLSNRIDEAIDRFKMAIDNNPIQAEAFKGLGIAYARKGNYQMAAGGYQMFLDLSPQEGPDTERVRAIILDYYRKKR